MKNSALIRVPKIEIRMETFGWSYKAGKRYKSFT
jgi:hypothetical protein